MAEAPTVAYIKMTQPQANVHFGKMQKDRVYAMPPEQAGRFMAAGIAVESDQAAFDRQRNEQAEAITERHSRAGEFAALNQEAAGAWDTSTTRDVTMAPEEGIRQAFAAGRLVNTDRLKDETGAPLPPDAGLEQILEARKRLGFGEAPFTEHERSSAMGGGAHTHALGGMANAGEQGSTLQGAVPLNQPSHKLTPEQLGNAPTGDADEDDSDDAPRSRSRSKR
jgi:hypothetical protein